MLLPVPARGCRARSQKNFPSKAILKDVLELNFTIKFVVLIIANAARSIKYVNYLLFLMQLYYFRGRYFTAFSWNLRRRISLKRLIYHSCYRCCCGFLQLNLLYKKQGLNKF